MIKYPGANIYKEVGESLSAGHVHLSSNERETVEQVISIRKTSESKKMTLSWDPQELLFEELLPFFDYVFINEDDLKRKTGMTTVREAAQTLETTSLIVTKNGGGCTIFGEKFMDVPSFNIKALDSTGAGDAFDAGFIFGLQHQLSTRECGILGTACASIKVQHYGARGGITTQKGLKKFLKQYNLDML